MAREPALVHTRRVSRMSACHHESRGYLPWKTGVRIERIFLNQPITKGVPPAMGRWARERTAREGVGTKSPGDESRTISTIEAPSGARFVVIGGEPLDGPGVIWWNFVSSSNARIEQAKRDWKEGRFPKVPGDEIESIPLPE